MGYLELAFLYASIALPPVLSPDIAYPQFGKNDLIQPIVKQCQKDIESIEAALRKHGATYVHDGQAWQKVPEEAEPIRQAWIEAKQVKGIWDHVDWLTWPKADAQQRKDSEAALRREIGDYFFQRGLLPLPLSMRTRPD